MEKFGLAKKSLSALLLAAALTSGNSYAARIVVDFEGVGDLAAINEFYNFGIDSVGNTGTDYGIYFSNAAFGIIDADVDPLNFHGNFANAPSATTALIFLEGGAAMMNTETGFDSGLSLSYSSSTNATVKIYDALNGTGKLLASLNLITNFENNDCRATSADAYCHWDQAGVTFSGIAKSVVFEGQRLSTLYDNIILGSAEQNDCKRGFKRSRRNRGCNDDTFSLAKDERREYKDYFRWHRKNRSSKWHD
jgi:hypothetical protein